MITDISAEQKEKSIFWENTTFHPNIVKELRRRKHNNNVGIANINFEFPKNLEEYKGPMTSWVRICSNGTGQVRNSRVPRSKLLTQDKYNGFILDGGSGFGETYGFEEQIGILKASDMRIGRDVNNRPILIRDSFLDISKYSINGTESPIGLPAPGIKSVSVRNNGNFMTECTVNFTCYGLAQLEFLFPFFLTPGIYMFVEFGWNVFNTNSLLPLENISVLQDEIQYPEKFLKRSYASNGNYGLVQGGILDYGYSSQDNITYDCFFKVLDTQGLFAGNPVTSTSVYVAGNGNSSQIYGDLKTSMINHLDSVFGSVVKGSNFLKHISEKERVDIMSGPLGKLISEKDKNFYDNKKEDRIFCARNSKLVPRNYSFKFIVRSPTRRSIDRGGEFDRNANNINPIEFNIQDGVNIYSNIDESDFDNGSDNTNDVWVSLDFVFEYINLFLPNEFQIDIDDVIINAHPNLISCDLNVLIPNPIAPKINYGGHNPSSDISESTDYFQTDQYKVEIQVNSNDSLYKSFEKSRKVLKQNRGKHGNTFARENLDVIINYVPYLKNKNSSESRAFPFTEDVIVNNKIYSKYKYGYLKHLYIHKNRLKNLISSDGIQDVKQFVQGILDEINNSVGNYWKLIIVNTGTNKLSIMDVGMNNISEIYQFKVGTIDSFVIKHKFDVSMSSEQATNILFGSGNNTYDMSDNNDINGKTTTDGSTTSIPTIAYADRFSESDSKPTTYQQRARIGFSNNSLAVIQRNSIGSSILKMTFKVDNSNDLNISDNKYTNTLVSCLNMEDALKGVLISMLNDEDYDGNASIYANVADNFIFEFSLDGIYGIKVFENFSVSNLPKPYTPDNVIFQVKEFDHEISNGRWVTNIRAFLKGVYKENTRKYIQI